MEPNSGLGEAISYLLKHWEKLTLFLRKAGAPLNNNATNAARGIYQIMPIPGLCRVHWILEVPQRFKMVADAA